MLTLLISRILLISMFHAVHISYGDITITHDSLKGNLTFFKDDWSKATERPEGCHSMIVDSRAIISEYSDQMNLLTVTTGNSSKNLVLTSDNTFATIKL